MWNASILILAQETAPTPAPEATAGRGEAPPASDLPAVSAPAGDQKPVPGGDTSTTIPGNSQQTQSAPQGNPWGMLPFVLIIVVFMMVLFGGQRREKKKRAQVLASMEKGAKVQTIGGVQGTIMELREHDVLLKVDENTNTRIRFNRSAIQTVIKDD